MRPPAAVHRSGTEDALRPASRGRKPGPGSITRRRPGKNIQRMKHQTTRSLYTYWNALRGERLAPRRFEIEPGRIGDILPDTFILERQDQQCFPYRLTGTRICELFGSDFRGTDFMWGWPERDLPALRSRLNTISVQGGAAVFTAEGITDSGRSILLEIIALPLVHTHAFADRFLGAISPLQRPAWLGSEPIAARQLLSDDIIWPDGRPRDIVDVMDRQSPFVPRMRHARIVRQDRRQFRVYDGGRTDPSIEES